MTRLTSLSNDQGTATDTEMTMSSDDLLFGPDCDKHDYRCWSCGKPRYDTAGVLGKAVGYVVALLLSLIVVAPLLWLVRVTLGWAL
jgi:hypothetical protein